MELRLPFSLSLGLKHNLQSFLRRACLSLVTTKVQGTPHKRPKEPEVMPKMDTTPTLETTRTLKSILIDMIKLLLSSLFPHRKVSEHWCFNLKKVLDIFVLTATQCSVQS